MARRMCRCPAEIAPSIAANRFILVRTQTGDADLSLIKVVKVACNLLKPLNQIARREPFRQCPRFSGRQTRIPEPDARLGGELLHIRAAVGDEQKGSTKLLKFVGPRAIEAGLVWGCLNIARIALGLPEPARNIFKAAFGLNPTDTALLDEKSVVDWAAIGRPLSNGDGLSRLRSNTSRISQQSAATVQPVARSWPSIRTRVVALSR